MIVSRLSILAVMLAALPALAQPDAGTDIPRGAEKLMRLPHPNGGDGRAGPRQGMWYHGRHDGRLGWWWRQGGAWFFYGSSRQPFPDIYGEAGTSPGHWRWCDKSRDFYPFVLHCPSGWREVTPR